MESCTTPALHPTPRHVLKMAGFFMYQKTTSPRELMVGAVTSSGLGRFLV